MQLNATTPVIAVFDISSLLMMNGELPLPPPYNYTSSTNIGTGIQAHDIVFHRHSRVLNGLCFHVGVLAGSWGQKDIFCVVKEKVRR